MRNTRPRTQPFDLTALPLPTDAPLIVFDETCVLCSRFVQWVIRHDHRRVFRFTSAQGQLGQALYRHLDLDPTDLQTNLLVVSGAAYGKFRGVIETAKRLGGPWRAVAIFGWVPAPLGDWLYDRIAQNRHVLFGRHAVCWTPPADIADRII